MLTTIFGVLSSVLAVTIYIPYGHDIVRVRAKPSRSTRAMLTLVLLLALLQQGSLGGGMALAVSAGELVGSLLILKLSLKHGMGGMLRSDFVCYGLLVVSIAAWLTTGSALLALHLSIVADLISCMPTFIKTWRLPDTETPLFYWGGIVAAGLSLAAGGTLSYAVVLFPAYLIAANVLQLVLIHLPRRPALV